MISKQMFKMLLLVSASVATSAFAEPDKGLQQMADAASAKASEVRDAVKGANLSAPKKATLKTTAETAGTLVGKYVAWQLSKVKTVKDAKGNALAIKIAVDNSIPDFFRALFALGFDSAAEKYLSAEEAAASHSEELGCALISGMISAAGAGVAYDKDLVWKFFDTERANIGLGQAKYVALGAVLRAIESGAYKNSLLSVAGGEQVLPLFESIQKFLNGAAFDIDCLAAINMQSTFIKRNTDADGNVTYDANAKNTQPNVLISKILCKWISPLVSNRFFMSNSPKMINFRKAVAAAILSPIVAAYVAPLVKSGIDKTFA